MSPEDELSRIADAQRRFDVAVANLSDDDVRRPSLLPDWTVGHVLAHVARNADSHRRRTEAATRGELVEQYPGGYEGREAEIRAGASRSAAELVDDVRVSAEQMMTAWRAVPDAAWDNPTLDVAGRERPLRSLLGRRWQEVEVHLVDLDVGITHRDWPDEFVTVWRPRLHAYFGDQAPATTGLDAREELAWLFGRLTRADLPVLAPWG